MDDDQLFEHPTGAQAKLKLDPTKKSPDDRVTLAADDFPEDFTINIGCGADIGPFQGFQCDAGKRCATGGR